MAPDHLKGKLPFPSLCVFLISESGIIPTPSMCVAALSSLPACLWSCGMAQLEATCPPPLPHIGRTWHLCVQGSLLLLPPQLKALVTSKLTLPALPYSFLSLLTIHVAWKNHIIHAFLLWKEKGRGRRGTGRGGRVVVVEVGEGSGGRILMFATTCLIPLPCCMHTTLTAFVEGLGRGQ